MAMTYKLRKAVNAPNIVNIIRNNISVPNTPSRKFPNKIQPIIGIAIKKPI
jgi:hypothetical protein